MLPIQTVNFLGLLIINSPFIRKYNSQFLFCISICSNGITGIAFFITVEQLEYVTKYLSTVAAIDFFYHKEMLFV